MTAGQEAMLDDGGEELVGVCGLKVRMDGV